MMAYPIYNFIPVIPKGKTDVLCNAWHPYMLDKIAEIMLKNGFQFENHSTFIRLDVDDFTGFIQAVAGDSTFTEL
jgi:hypothetical protein